MLTPAWLARLIVLAVVSAGGLVLVAGLLSGPAQQLRNALASDRQADTEAAGSAAFPLWALLLAGLLVVGFLMLSARAYFGPTSV